MSIKQITRHHYRKVYLPKDRTLLTVADYNAIVSALRDITGTGVGGDLATVNALNGDDLDLILDAKEYYFDNTCTNSPFTYGLLKVWRADATNVCQIAQDFLGDGLATRFYNGTIWTAWNHQLSKARAVANGIDADLATTNELAVANLDAFNTVGEYHVNLSGLVPVQYGLLKVWRETENNVYQLITDALDGNLFLRHGARASNVNPLVWTPWISPFTITNATRHGLVTDLGLSGSVNRLGSVNLNTVITPGKYCALTSCTNLPANTDTVLIEVWRESAIAIGQKCQCIYSTSAGLLNKNGKSFSRSSLDGGATWTEWFEDATTNRMLANGIDVELAVTNEFTGNINTLARTGVYWVISPATNAPFFGGILNVTCLNSTDSIQEIYGRGVRATRYGYGGVAYAGHTWTSWVFSEQTDISVTSNLFTLSVDLDIVVNSGEYYFGNSCPGKPFDYGLLKVWREDSTLVYQMAQGAGDVGIATRYRDNLGVWTPWNKPVGQVNWTYLWEILQDNGIDRNLALNAGATSTPNFNDLNGLLTVGEYWIDNSISNNPFNFLLPASNHCALKVWRNSPLIVLQLAQSLATGALAGRSTTDGGATWTPWVYPAPAASFVQDNKYLVPAITSTYTIAPADFGVNKILVCNFSTSSRYLYLNHTTLATVANGAAVTVRWDSGANAPSIEPSSGLDLTPFGSGGLGHELPAVGTTATIIKVSATHYMWVGPV